MDDKATQPHGYSADHSLLKQNVMMHPVTLSGTSGQPKRPRGCVKKPSTAIPPRQNVTGHGVEKKGTCRQLSSA